MCSALLARTGWSPQRLAAELTRRELRTATQPVRVLAYRARVLLETAPAGHRPPPEPASPARTAHPPEGQQPDAPPADASTGPQIPAVGELDALDPATRRGLLEAARARLRRIGLSRGGGDFPDHHPLLRGEAVNLLHQAATPETGATGPAPDTPGSPSQGRTGEPVLSAADTALHRPARDHGATHTRPGNGREPTPGDQTAADVAPTPAASAAAQPARAQAAGRPPRPNSPPRHRVCHHAHSADLRHAAQAVQDRPPPSPPAATSPASARSGASQDASRPRGRDPPAR